MKTYFKSAALAIVGIAAISCSNKTDGTGDNVPSPIGFKTYIDKSTKGSPVTETHLSDDFGVYGYWNQSGQGAMSSLTPNLFANQRIEFNTTDSTFSYSPVRTWPLNGYVNFYAYTPYNYEKVVGLPADNTVSGYPSFSFEVPDVVASQKDLMVAALEHLDGTSPNVVFDFNHALTQVIFVAHTAGDYQSNLGTTVKIRSISIEGVANSGTFKYDNFVNNSDKGTWWSSVSGTKTYNIGLYTTNPSVPYYTPVDGVETYMVVNASDQSLLGMPQSFESGSAAKIVVQYSVFDSAGDEQQLTKQYPLAGTQAWEPGMRVVYALSFSLNAITFDANTTRWADSFQDIRIENPS